MEFNQNKVSLNEFFSILRKKKMYMYFEQVRFILVQHEGN